MAFPLLCQENNVNVVIATTSTIQNNNDELSLMKMVFAATMIPLKSFAINQANSAEFLHSFLIHEFYYPLLKIPVANLMNNSWRLRWALCIVVRYKLIPLWIEIKYCSFEREFRFDERAIKRHFIKTIRYWDCGDVNERLQQFDCMEVRIIFILMAVLLI